MTNIIKRKIAIKDYYGRDKHIYEDELGFRKRMKSEARSLVAREVFRYHVEEVGLNLAFYYPKTDTFYGIHTESIPIKVKILPRHREWSDFVGWQCENDTHDEESFIVTLNHTDRTYSPWSSKIYSLRQLPQINRK